GIPDLLDECANRGVKFVHIFSGRLSETGNRKAANLEADILRKAKALNIRLIGPNCMGIFHPRLGISYSDDLPKEPGDVGGLFQSGGLSILFSRYGGLQGLRFSKIISFGNALDLDECDFLEYLAHDEETKIITCYIEGAKDGARLLDVLREATSVKPVVMLKGGKGIIGKKTAGSHTSALAGSDAVWQTALRQTGVIQVDDVNQLVDVVTLFSSLPSIKGRRAAVIGASGGQSVLAADACERVGFELPPLPSEVKEVLKSRMPELSDWIGNPIDVSAAGAFFRPGEMLEMVAKNPEFDFTIVNIDEGAPVHQEMWCDIIGGVIDSAIDLSQKQVKPIIAVLSGGKIHQQQFSEWRWQFLADLRSRLIAAHVPVYSTMIEAVTALKRYIDFCITREDG
ncbi:MAG: hypothetical protein SVM79_08825, partial [Chloroflexota bacterium]|nr:hypothetical protein [Chloroflexota bacterium]